MNLPKVGDRLIVQNIRHVPAIVSEIIWLPKEARHEIRLDWGSFGQSKVYDSDENKTWYRHQANN